MKTADKRKLDKIFAKIVRTRGKCERCGTSFNLQCSHINGRSLFSVRWDPINAQCLCASCHGWFTHYRTAGVIWVKNLYGERKFAELEERTKKLAYSLSVEDIIKRWEEFGWDAKLWESQFRGGKR